MEKPEYTSGIEQLKAKMSHVAKESPTYEKLAYYIEKNFMRIIFMTAGEVAEEASISQGSVSRFSVAMGFRGYNDFLRNTQKYISEQITAPQRLQYTTQNGGDEKIDGILNMEHKNIDELQNIIHSPGYMRLVAEIVAAKEVVLLSARMSATLLPYTGYILNKIRNGVFEVTPHVPCWDTLSQRDPSSTLIFTLIFPRYPNILIQKMKELRSAGFRIAAITDSVISPVEDLADPVLQIPTTVSSIFDIYSTPMIFLNLLMRDVAKRTEGLEQRLNALEKLDDDHSNYFRI